MIVASITLRLKAIRAAAAFPEVRLVGDFPEANLGPALAIMLHEPGDQPVPLFVVVRLDDFVVNLGKEGARFEAQAHERLGPCLADGICRPIQGLKVVLAVSALRVEALLNEDS